MHIHSDALKKEEKKTIQLSYIFVGFAHYSDHYVTSENICLRNQ